jgi:hypothetical protein
MPATAVPVGAWLFLGLHVLVDGALILAAWLATRRPPPAAYDFELLPGRLPFDELKYLPPVTAGNPIWRTMLYFAFAAVVVLALGYALMRLFGP